MVFSPRGKLTDPSGFLSCNRAIDWSTLETDATRNQLLVLYLSTEISAKDFAIKRVFLEREKTGVKKKEIKPRFEG